MPSTPVDDHTEEFEQLAGLSALDVLEGDELARFEQHAAQCERCRVMARLDREALARIAPEMDPSPDFKQRLLDRARRELSQAEPHSEVQREPVPLHITPSNVISFRSRSAWVSGLAAILVVGLVGAGAFTYENQVVASYPLTGAVSGSAVVNVKRSGAAELDLRGVQNPPDGSIYEAWIIPKGGQPIAAGTTPAGDATLP